MNSITTIITDKETKFINFLEDDYKIRGKNSFMNILFGSSLETMENIKKDALYGSGSLKKFLKNCIFIMSIKNGFYLGKYEEHFFVYTSEGELLGAGKEIQNTCSFLRNLLYFSLDDKRVIEDMFQRKGFNSYDEVIMNYKKFCNNMMLEFHEEDEYWEKQAEDFNDKYAL